MSESEAREAGFRLACGLDELAAGRPRLATTEHGRALLVRAGSDARPEVHAFSPMCPHQLGDLSEGEFSTGHIECPLHGYRFDARTGACVWPADGPTLRTYATRIIGDEVWVRIDRPRWMSAPTTGANSG